MNHLLKAGFLLFFLSFGVYSATAQKKEIVVFYNVENFFDTEDDSLYRDDDFTASGIFQWDSSRYFKKQKSIFKVITTLSEWSPPAIICLAEIENSKVAVDFIRNTPLTKLDYMIVHYDSPDERGMDVALIYRESVFNLDTSFVIPVYLEDGKKFSRDILIVRGTMHGRSLCMIVNHWPSRRGGVAISEKYRLKVAELLRKQLIEVIDAEPDLHLIITGDFNDEAQDESLQMLTEESTAINLQVLPFQYSGKVKGTLKYKGNWFTFDQFIVSANMLEDEADLYVHQKKANIFEAEFLLKKEKKSMGFKPYRTYLGSYYAGGYSDHLPVYIELIIN